MKEAVTEQRLAQTVYSADNAQVPTVQSLPRSGCAVVALGEIIHSSEVNTSKYD